MGSKRKCAASDATPLVVTQARVRVHKSCSSSDCFFSSSSSSSSCTVPLSLPHELWFVVFECCITLDDIFALAVTCRDTYSVIRHAAQSWPWYRWCTPHSTQYFLLQRRPLWKPRWVTVRAIVLERCALCSAPCHSHEMEWNPWNLYAHVDCILRETLSITTALARYDLAWEEIQGLPVWRNQVWKFHGGRPVLPFGLEDTLQGVCLMVHKENLHQRRQNIKRLRHTLRTRLRQEQVQARQWTMQLRVRGGP